MKFETSIGMRFGVIVLALVLSVVAACQAKPVDSGRKLWANIHTDGYMANDMAIDRDGNVYLAGYSGDSGPNTYSVVKIDNGGKQKWVRYFGGPGSLAEDFEFYGSDDLAPAITVDQEGSVYVSGVGWTSDKEADFAGNHFITIKYDPGGRRKWIRRYGGGDMDTPLLNDIAVDDRANIYVFGSAGMYGDGVIVVKYDAAGKQEWARRDLPGAWLTGGAVDRDGNVYLVGGSLGVSNGTDIFGLKYDTKGRLRWVKRYNAGDGIVAGMALDGDGNMYISAGDAGEAGRTRSRAFTIKYDTDGRLKWLRENFPRNKVGVPGPIAVDRDGNAYVARLGRPISFVKFDRDGHRRSVKDESGVVLDLAVGPTGNVFAIGYLGTGRVDFGAKFDSRGNRKWSKLVRGGRRISAMAVDDRDNFYVTGTMDKRRGPHRSRSGYFTIKYAR